MKKLIPAVAMALGISVPGFGLEPLPFDGTQWRPVNLKFPGSETIRVENVPLETTGRQVPALCLMRTASGGRTGSRFIRGVDHISHSPERKEIIYLPSTHTGLCGDTVRKRSMEVYGSFPR